MTKEFIEKISIKFILLFIAITTIFIYQNHSTANTLNLFHSSCLGLKYIFMIFFFYITGYFYMESFIQPQTKIEWDFVISIVLGIAIISLFGIILAVVDLYNVKFLFLTSIFGFFIYYKYGKYKPSYQEYQTNDAFLNNLNIFMLLLLITIFLYSPPFEWIWGGADAGVYNHFAGILNNYGRIIYQDSVLKIFGTSGLKFSSPMPGKKYVGLKYAGFYILNAENSKIVPQFFPVYPIILSISQFFLGKNYYLYINTFLGFLSLLIFFHLFKELFNSKYIALVSTCLLAFNLQQIWSVRSSLTEITSQIFIWTTIFLIIFITKQKKLKRYFNSLGLLLIISIISGAFFFTRIDSVFFIVSLSTIPLFISDILPKKELNIFSLVTTTLIGLSFLYSITIEAPYSYDVFQATIHLKASFVYSLFFILVLLAMFSHNIFFIQNSFILFKEKLQNKKLFTYFRYILAFIILVLACYSYFIYSKPQYYTISSLIFKGKPLPTFNNTNFYRLGWFFSPIGLFLITIGLALFIIFEEKRERLIVILFAIPWFYYLYHLCNNPVQLYGFRRYIPIIIPFMVFLAGYLINFCVIKRYYKISYLIVFILLTNSILISKPLICSENFNGSLKQLAYYFKHIPHKKSLIIIDKRNGVAHWQGPPLEFLLNYPVYPITLNRLNIDILKKALDHYPHVYILTKYKSKIKKFKNIRLIKIKDFLINVPRLKQSYYTLPRGMTRYKTALSLYQIKRLK